MTLGQRAYLGALFGALIVLLLHPASRALFSGGLWRFRTSAILANDSRIPANDTVAPNFHDASGAALWILLACQIQERGTPILKSDLSKLLSICDAYSEQEVDNAFWPQVASCIDWELGDKRRSLQDWERASTRLRWDDHQVERLKAVVEDLDREAGGKLSWHHAALVREKSSAVTARLSRHAERLADLPLSPEDRVKFQMSLIANGTLIRSGGKSNLDARTGMAIIEKSAYPLKGDPYVNYRRLLTARSTFLDHLRESGRAADLAVADKAFRDNDGLRAFMDNPEAGRSFLDSAILGAACASLPGCAALIGLLGFGAFLVGRVLERVSRLSHIHPSWPLIGGLLTGVSIYGLLGLKFAAVCAACAVASHALVSVNRKEGDPSDLGWRIPVVAVTLSVFAGFLMWIGLAAICPGTRAISSMTTPEFWPTSQSALLLTYAIVLLAAGAALTAWTSRAASVPRFQILGRAMAIGGKSVALTMLSAAVFLGPMCISLDQFAAETVRKVLANEPLYYFVFWESGPS